MLENLIQQLGISKSISGFLTVITLLVIALIGYYLTILAIRNLLIGNLKKIKNRFIKELAISLNSRLFGNIVIAVTFRVGSDFIDNHELVYSAYLAFAINKLSILYLNIIILLILTNIVNQINQYYKHTVKNAKFYSIKPYLNVIIFLIWLFGIIFIVAYFSNTSLTKVFAGIGAASAVFLLLFKDTLLGIVSSIQASISNIAQIGDRIAIDKYNLDGVVLDISITNVKIKSFDNVTITIPTYMLTSEVVKNFKSIYTNNSRRIRKTIHIDVNSIRSLQEDEMIKFDSLKLLERYSATKNTNRIITNLEIFRLYLEDYIRHIPYIRQDEDLLVYQLSPTPNGIPIEIYIYTTLTNFIECEQLQSQIIAYAIIKMREFDLIAFQNTLVNLTV